MTTSKKKAKQRKSKNNVKLGPSNLVIGLTGPFGSGCSKMREVLAQEDFGFRPFKISEDIRGELESTNKLIERGKPGWRRVLQKHGALHCNTC